jgi:hypothetical protein
MVESSCAQLNFGCVAQDVSILEENFSILQLYES